MFGSRRRTKEEKGKRGRRVGFWDGEFLARLLGGASGLKLRKRQLSFPWSFGTEIFSRTTNLQKHRGGQFHVWHKANNMQLSDQRLVARLASFPF